MIASAVLPIVEHAVAGGRVVPLTRALTTSRTFPAPRRIVWQVVTGAEHLPHWYGPRDATVVVCEHDLRVGGRFRYLVRTADGRERAVTGEYLEVVPERRVVSRWWSETMPAAAVVETTTFEEHDGRTTVTVHGSARPCRPRAVA